MRCSSDLLRTFALSLSLELCRLVPVCVDCTAHAPVVCRSFVCTERAAGLGEWRRVDSVGKVEANDLGIV